MDGASTKFYSLEDKVGIFKVMKPIDTFYDEQMKLLKPTYFSPDLKHRLIYEPALNIFTLNSTLTNSNLLTIPIDSKHMMFQKKDLLPMIYFHSNDQIVYLTV
jgi:hypothetical protein